MIVRGDRPARSSPTSGSMKCASSPRRIAWISASASGCETGVVLANRRRSVPVATVAASVDSGASSSSSFSMIWQAASKLEYQRGPTARSGTAA